MLGNAPTGANVPSNAAMRSRLEFEFAVDLDWDPMRQLRHPDSSAGMLAGLWPKQRFKIEQARCRKNRHHEQLAR